MAIKQLLVPMAPPDLAPLQDLAPPHLPHAHQPRLSGQKLSPSPVPQQLRQENVIPLSSGILQVGQGHNSWGDFFFFFLTNALSFSAEFPLWEQKICSVGSN